MFGTVFRSNSEKKNINKMFVSVFYKNKKNSTYTYFILHLLQLKIAQTKAVVKGKKTYTHPHSAKIAFMPSPSVHFSLFLNIHIKLHLLPSRSCVFWCALYAANFILQKQTKKGRKKLRRTRAFLTAVFKCYICPIKLKEIRVRKYIKNAHTLCVYIM